MVKVQEDSSPSYISDKRAVKKFVRQMVKNHEFIGHYIEQRYVPELASYKKIVKISPKEDNFIENLTVIERRIKNFFCGTKWVGITFPNMPGAPVGFNLWVDIDEEVFGTYLFLVKDVQFSKNQVTLKLEVINPGTKRHSVTDCSKQNSDLHPSFANEDIEINKNGDVILSWNNVKKAAVFMFLLMSAILVGSSQLIMFLMDYVLKLLRELGNIIKVTTPICLACFEAMSRMFGYVCFLIALLWKDRHSPVKGTTVRGQHISYIPAYPYENRYKALPYNMQKDSVVLTEIHD